eukprot:4703161-Amphidinium_carterae.1
MLRLRGLRHPNHRQLGTALDERPFHWCVPFRLCQKVKGTNGISQQDIEELPADCASYADRLRPVRSGAEPRRKRWHPSKTDASLCSYFGAVYDLGAQKVIATWTPLHVADICSSLGNKFVDACDDNACFKKAFCIEPRFSRVPYDIWHMCLSG